MTILVGLIHSLINVIEMAPDPLHIYALIKVIPRRYPPPPPPTCGFLDSAYCSNPGDIEYIRCSLNIEST